MIFEEKTIILKDGRTAILKSPCVEDAEKLLNYIKKSCKRLFSPHTLRGKVFILFPLFFISKRPQTLGKEVFYAGY